MEFIQFLCVFSVSRTQKDTSIFPVQESFFFISIHCFSLPHPTPFSRCGDIFFLALWCILILTAVVNKHLRRNCVSFKKKLCYCFYLYFFCPLWNRARLLIKQGWWWKCRSVGAHYISCSLVAWKHLIKLDGWMAVCLWYYCPFDSFSWASRMMFASSRSGCLWGPGQIHFFRLDYLLSLVWLPFCVVTEVVTQIIVM